jgi:hypothetical protein
MDAIQLKQNISTDQYEMAIRVLKAMGVIDEETENEKYEPYFLTEEDLISIAQSDEDLMNGRVTNSKDVHQKARELCGK